MKPTQLTLAQGRRLKAARKSAGFRSARAAATEFEWPESTYRSHEAGTRTIGQDDADRYARFFRARGAVVSGQSILFGSTGEDTPVSLSAVQRLFDDLPAEAQPEAVRYLEYLRTSWNELSRELLSMKSVVEPKGRLTRSGPAKGGGGGKFGVVVVHSPHRKTQP